MNGITIERVRGNSESVFRELAALLMDAVESNAGISFMSDLRIDRAAEWWRNVLGNAPPRMVVLTRVGVVPNFALNPDSSTCDTVFFYKQL